MREDQIRSIFLVGISSNLLGVSSDLLGVGSAHSPLAILCLQQGPPFSSWHVRTFWVTTGYGAFGFSKFEAVIGRTP